MKKTIVLLFLCFIVIASTLAQTTCDITTSEEGSENVLYMDVDDFYYFATIIIFHSDLNAISFFVCQNPLGPYGSFADVDFGKAIIINNNLSKIKLTYNKELSEKATNSEDNKRGTRYIYSTEDVDLFLNVLSYGYYFTVTGTKESLTNWEFPKISTFIDMCELLM